MIFQKTLKGEVFYKGIGLHTGNSCEMTLSPAPAGSGIHFFDLDNDKDLKIPVSLDCVSDTFRGTTLRVKESRVHTVEHVLAVLYGLEIDNANIHIKGREPAAVDGSGLPFAEKILSVGIEEQNSLAKILKLNHPATLESPKCRASYLPQNHLTLDFHLQYPNTPVGNQRYQYVQSPENFMKEIAPARTFGFKSEVDHLHGMGLALGGSLDNAVIIDDDKILNGVLRFEDEFVRHKILDVMGDLCLLGRRIHGLLSFIRSGHTFNVSFAKRLLALYTTAKTFSLENTVLNFEEIQAIIPHRYPFLLVDRIIYLDAQTAVGVKNVTGNEEFFQGHFPEKAVMPGVLIVEALAQVAGVLMLNKEEHKGKIPYFTGINHLRIRKPVVPGDTLQLEVKVLKVRGNTGKVAARARVFDKDVAEGELMFTLNEGK